MGAMFVVQSPKPDECPARDPFFKIAKQVFNKSRAETVFRFSRQRNISRSGCGTQRV